LHLITNTISRLISPTAQLFALSNHSRIHKAQILTLPSISTQPQLRSCTAQFVKL